MLKDQAAPYPAPPHPLLHAAAAAPKPLFRLA